ncbi:response regulator [Roseibacterium sp. SDUM158017]|uniref:response regulator n=1 Tax=Roseicyclus salinarum TaxID=3036773 RepID=UPI0024150A4E|nr:response regulator [Roseibacterium sp. SDUM158017]MDG4647357.1 response regulator [Roseibacterium sp. SDUM158017]
MKNRAPLPPGREAGRDAPLSLNVLILDDVETDRLRLRRLLREAGLDFTLYEAADLAGFAARLDGASMDLVFLDYHLEMDTGLDALRILSAREDQAGALPIMVTSVGNCDVAVEAMRSGCADYLVKEQLSVEAIRKSVTSAFERRLLFAAFAEAKRTRDALSGLARRFAFTSGPEIRSVLSATLRHARSLRGHEAITPPFAEKLGALEDDCHEIFAFLSGVADILDGVEGSPARALPRAARE